MEAPMARSAARFSISTLALLALAACGQTTIATAPTPPPAIAATAVPINPDQDFLNRAMTGTGAQVELGRLAQQQGTAPSVRAFGAQIAAEHARMHARLTTASQRVGMVPTPAAPDLSRFAALSGPEFDREFITDQVKNQREALGLYESEAQAGQDPQGCSAESDSQFAACAKRRASSSLPTPAGPASKYAWCGCPRSRAERRRRTARSCPAIWRHGMSGAVPARAAARNRKLPPRAAC